jgi:hypothetical protein
MPPYTACREWYLPEKTTGPLPVIIWVYGGGTDGNKHWRRAVCLVPKATPWPTSTTA